MKKLLLLLPLLFLVSCNSLHKLTGASSGSNAPDTIPDIQTVSGTSNQDYPLVGGVRTDNSTISVRVMKSGSWVTLNKYEFTIVNSGVQMGHEVTVNGNQISYASPFVPVTPNGTKYEITSILNH